MIRKIIICLILSVIYLKFFRDIRFKIFIYSTILTLFINILYTFLKVLGFKVENLSIFFSFIPFFFSSEFAIKYNFEDIYNVIIFLIFLDILDILNIHKYKKIKLVLENIKVRVGNVIQPIVMFIKMLLISIRVALIFSIFLYLFSYWLSLPQSVPLNFNNLIFSYLEYYIWKNSSFLIQSYDTGDDIIILAGNRIYRLENIISYLYSKSQYKKLICLSLLKSVTPDEFYTLLILNALSNLIDKKHKLFYSFNSSKLYNLSNVVPFNLIKISYPADTVNFLSLKPIKIKKYEKIKYRYLLKLKCKIYER